MSLIPHNFFPRKLFDMNEWFKAHPEGLTTLDIFDPFDELDHMIGHNLEWLNKPEFLQPFPLVPKVPQKYRITVDCHGYNPKSIKTEIKGLKLIVSGREEEKQEGEDFSIKEFKKTYDLPAHAEVDKLVSFMTGNGHLVIEVPLKEIEHHQHTDLFPQIIDTENGGKAVSLKFGVPAKIDPSKISVSIKDRDLIVKAEDKVEKPDGISKFYYYKRTTLPENTDFEQLKCNYDNHKISVAAPLKLDFKSFKKVPIEYKKQQEQITSPTVTQQIPSPTIKQI
jgi:HSP20 family molecular chaperone IbpA